jgi:MFS family permease
LFAATVLSYLDRGVIAVLSPGIKADLNITDVEMSLIKGLSFAFFFAVAGLPIGWLVDRRNRRNIIMVGVLLWSLMTALCGLAPNFHWLLVARMGVGIGEACLVPAAYSIIADYFAPQRRARTMALMNAGAAIGGAGSGIIGGVLLLYLGTSSVLPSIIQLAHWRIVFLLFALPGPLVALLLLTVREPVRAAVAARPAGAFVAFLRKRAPEMAGLYFMFAMSFAMQYALVLWSPTVLVRSFAFDQGQAGILLGTEQLILNILGTAFAGLLGDSLMRHRGMSMRLLLFLVCMPLVMIGGSLIFFATSVTAYLVGAGLIMFLGGVLVTLSYPMLYDVVPASTRGQAAAVYMLAGNIIGLGGAPLAVGLLNDLGFENLFGAQASVGLVIASAGLLSLAVALAISRRYERLREQNLAAQATPTS